MKTAFLVYDGVSVLDLAGPYEVVRAVPGSSVRLVAETAFVAAEGGLRLSADCSIDELSDQDVTVIPGGAGARNLLAADTALAWIEAAYRGSDWTAATGTGVFLLAAVGALRDRQATTCSYLRDRLRSYGADPLPRRYVVDGSIVTSTGGSAGIDMALTLISLICDDEVAETARLAIDYDPSPPLDASPAAAADPRLLHLAGQSTPAIDRAAAVQAV